jgi:hypothetical protein
VTFHKSPEGGHINVLVLTEAGKESTGGAMIPASERLNSLVGT